MYWTETEESFAKMKDNVNWRSSLIRLKNKVCFEVINFIVIVMFRS